jgi:hypothetical protein
MLLTIRSRAKKMLSVINIIYRASDVDLINFENCEHIISEEIEGSDLFILNKQLLGANGLDVFCYIKNKEKYKMRP